VVKVFSFSLRREQAISSFESEIPVESKRKEEKT